MPSIFDKHYDAGAARLTITFDTGRIYVYEGVPPDVAAAFDAAASKHEFFDAHVRNRYRFHEITPTQE